jgi:hypothetical protein
LRIFRWRYEAIALDEAHPAGNLVFASSAGEVGGNVLLRQCRASQDDCGNSPETFARHTEDSDFVDEGCFVDRRLDLSGIDVLLHAKPDPGTVHHVNEAVGVDPAEITAA